jgi:hypothetical protein
MGAIRAEPVPYSWFTNHAGNVPSFSAGSTDFGFGFPNGFIAPAARVSFNKFSKHINFHNLTFYIQEYMGILH